jgi:hypothetical protein
MLPVLQISDLHRSPTDPITNAELVATVLQEHDHAVNRGMEPIRAIIVCGDLIQGCPLATPNFEEILRGQYAVAHDLLTQLTDILLDGNISRLIVVPGNHDVCWNTARSAMVEATEAEVKDAFNLLQIPGSNFRWDWKTLTLFKISDPVRYSNRLAPYRNFFRDLYGSRIPETVNGDAWLFPIENVLFVGFESCSGTDCFNHAGALTGESIGQVATAIRGRNARLRAAVWHHNIEGPPVVSDYLDGSYIRRLVYYGFRLGLHGHQHFAATSPLYIHTDRDEIMAVVSAGSLCAGRRDLPTGRQRGFNFLTIDEDQHHARVRSLAMDLEARVQPEYAFNGGSADREVRWTPAPEDTTLPDDVREATLEAERAKNEGRLDQAKETLVAHFSDLGVYGRSLLLQVLLEQKDLDDLLRMFGEQLNRTEIPAVIAALIDAGRAKDAASLVERYQNALTPDSRHFFQQRINLLMSGGNDGR